jgi:hypothetical protein
MQVRIHVCDRRPSRRLCVWLINHACEETLIESTKLKRERPLNRGQKSGSERIISDHILLYHGSYYIVGVVYCIICGIVGKTVSNVTSAVGSYRIRVFTNVWCGIRVIRCIAATRVAASNIRGPRFSSIPLKKKAKYFTSWHFHIYTLYVFMRRFMYRCYQHDR